MRLFLASDENALTQLPDFLGADPTGLEIAFIPTAANALPDKSFLDADRRLLRGLGFTLREIDFESAPRADVSAALTEADVVLLEGGNSFYLLGRIRAHRFDELLEPVVRGGKPFVGVSAGGVVAGPDIEPLSLVADPLLQREVSSTVALGLTEYVVYPHYDDEERGAAYPEVVSRFGGRLRLVPLCDGQALVVADGQTRVVTARVRG